MTQPDRARPLDPGRFDGFLENELSTETATGAVAKATSAQSLPHRHPPGDIEWRAREQAIDLFHRAYRTSPAYRDFVNKSGIDISQIQGAADFERIPVMTKESYIHQYPLADRLIDGRSLADCYMMTATTGSTGEPVLWPRDYEIDQQLGSAFERVYRGCFRIDEKKTLHIIQNFLGVTPAGMIMTQLSWGASANHDMTTITPGSDIDRTLAMMSAMAPAYDQVIISTYPPYVGSFLDRAERIGLDITQYDLKFLCTGESFSEQWRNHIVSRLGHGAARQNIISAYGCTEAGLIGAETPFTVALAEAAMQSPQAAQALFNAPKVPNVIAYNPLSKLIEIYDGEDGNGDDVGHRVGHRRPSSAQTNQELLLTVDQPVPLIRYNMHDRGGLLTGSDVQQVIQREDMALSPPPDNAHFVYLMGRSDCVLLLTIAVYIEEIRFCLENSQFSQRFTGEFQYGTKVGDDYRDELNVVIHLKEGAVLDEEEQLRFYVEFWDNLLTINPTLQMPSEDMLNSAMLAIHFRRSEEGGIRGGKYQYFL